MSRKVLLLPGDGIGPEVTAQARRILEILAPHCGGIEFEEGDFGGVAIDKYDNPLPERTIRRAKKVDAVLLGAVGGPQYDELPLDQRPEKGLLRLRQELGVYTNLRPIKIFKSLLDHSSLRRESVEKVDFFILREFIGGIYFDKRRGITGEGKQREGYNTMAYTVEEIERIARQAFTLAMIRDRSENPRTPNVCSVDKANVLEVSRLWREVVTEVAKDYPDVILTHMYIDNAAMQLVRNPSVFDVIVTDNIFGDILSDLSGEIAGSLGMLPSAAIGGITGLYEPVHGSAPDIAGKNLANPCAAILCCVLIVGGGFSQMPLAKKLIDAVEDTISQGHRTADICRGDDTAISCSEMGDAICENLQKSL